MQIFSSVGLGIADYVSMRSHLLQEAQLSLTQLNALSHDLKNSSLDNDEAIESLWKSQYPLNDFIAPSAFKSYEELKTRLDTVLSGKTTVGNVTDSIEEETVAVPKVDTTPSEAPKVATSVDSEDQDSMDYFNKLANA